MSIESSLKQELSDLNKNGFVVVPIDSWESVNNAAKMLLEMVERKNKEIEALELRIKRMLERG